MTEAHCWPRALWFRIAAAAPSRARAAHGCMLRRGRYGSTADLPTRSRVRLRSSAGSLHPGTRTLQHAAPTRLP